MYGLYEGHARILTSPLKNVLYTIVNIVTIFVFSRIAGHIKRHLHLTSAI